MKHFELTEEFKLPLFMYSRATRGLFERILRDNRSRFTKGMVHFFSGSREELQALLDLDLYIGINGCSLQTEESLEIIKIIPPNRLVIESDSPYCDIKKEYACYQYVNTKFTEVDITSYQKDKMIKGRNEPCTIV